MQQMMRMFTTLLLAVLLSSCGGRTGELPDASVSESEIVVESFSDAQHSEKPLVAEPSATEPEPEDASDAEEELSPANDPFCDPSISHALAEPLLAVVQGFSGEYLFPEFESVADMPYSHRTVLSNVYSIAQNRREELLPDVPPLTPEEEAHVNRYSDGVTAFHRGDLNRIGRIFFGNDFRLPPESNGDEIGLIPETDFYSFLYARGLKAQFAYLITEIKEDGEFVIASFLPYRPLLNPDDYTIADVIFLDNITDPLSFVPYSLGELRYSSDEVRMNADIHSCLDSYYLRVPQDRLGTITVTFRQEQDDRYIAISCQYNRQ